MNNRWRGTKLDNPEPDRERQLAHPKTCSIFFSQTLSNNNKFPQERVKQTEIGVAA